MTSQPPPPSRWSARKRKAVVGIGEARRGGSERPPVERLVWIASKLRSDRPVTCSDIRDHFEVSLKTALRDITFLRDRLCYPIEWDSCLRTYRLTGPAPTANL